MPPLVTVHTPTWNRARTLPRVYEALKAQTFTDFEWIVSDDASTDGTLELLEKWQAEAPFDLRIRAFPQRAGKPAADNDAVRAARGTYFLQNGSDDYLVPEGLHRFIAGWDSVPTADRERFVSVTAQSVTEGGGTVGRFPTSPFDALNFDLSYRYKLHFDSSVMARTEILRSYPYPEVDYIVPESIVWLHAMGKRYYTRCLNDVVMILTRGGADTVTGSGRMRYNRGYAYALAKTLANRDVPWSARAKARAFLNLGRLSRHGGVSFLEAGSWLASSAQRAALAVAYPVGLAVAWRDRRLGKVDNTRFEPFMGNPVAIERASYVVVR